MQEFLANLIEKNPGDGGEFKTRAKFFDHKFFYLNTIFGGMGFGPQFRSVNPSAVTVPNGRNFAITTSQLPETEAWEMNLGWRPGYMDSGIQNSGTMFKPWTDP